MRIFILFVLSLCCLHSVEPSFEVLMGQETKYWRFLTTEEDLAILSSYKQLYERNRPYLDKTDEERIPPSIHFIWVGPHPFPETSKENVLSWIEHNPGWQIHFWTDRPRPLPVAGMILHLLQDFQWRFSPPLIYATSNYGEQSDVWRYEILLQHGGIYVDHDARCNRSVTPLQQVDFFTILEKPHPIDNFSSVIHTSIGLIGARAGHPILQRALELLQEKWDAVEREFGGTAQLVVQRTYKCFGEAVRSTIDLPGNRDILLPPAYFFADEVLTADVRSVFQPFADHLWAHAWQIDDPAYLKKTIAVLEKKGIRLAKKLYRTQLCASLLLGVSFALALLSFYVYRKLSRSHSRAG